MAVETILCSRSHLLLPAPSRLRCDRPLPACPNNGGNSTDGWVYFRCSCRGGSRLLCRGGRVSASALLSQTTSKAVQSWRVSVPVISSGETELLLFLFLPTEICSFAGQELSAEMCLAQLEPLVTAVKETIKNNICAHQQCPIGFPQC